MHHLNCRRAIPQFLFLVLSMCFAGTSAMAQGPCELPTVEGGATGYRPRGDRCEGIYGELQSGAGFTLTVASFTQSFGNFDPTTRLPLMVAWTDRGYAGLKLRAYSLVEEVYYRMDSQRPSGQNSYTWPTDVLASIDEFRDAAREKIGVVGITRRPLQGQTRDVYIPLKISQSGNSNSFTGFELSLIANKELTGLTAILTRVDANMPSRNLPPVSSTFSPFRPIKIPIPSLNAGTYRIDVSVESGTRRKAIRVYFDFAGS